MPRSSRRIAARQAELSRKKKRTGPRPSVVFEPPSEGGAPESASAAAVAAPLTDSGSPAPTAVAAPQPAPAVFGRRNPEAAPNPRRQQLQTPYLAGDMRQIGIIAAGLLAVLIALSFVIK